MNVVWLHVETAMFSFQHSCYWCRQIAMHPLSTGKDYLRLAKNEAAAKQSFQTKLREAVNGENIIYVISEKEHAQNISDQTQMLRQ